jgi:hypothetical protein
MRSVFRLFLLLTALFATGAWTQSAPAANTSRTVNATLVDIQPGPAVTVQLFGANANTVLKPADATVFAMLDKARPGDALKLNVDDPASPKMVTAVLAVQSERNYVSVALYLLAAAAILLAFGLLATRGRVQALIIGADKRYSMSKFQMAAWFFMLFMVYIASILVLMSRGWLDYIGKIEIPQNLVLLSGLSALTFGAAKAITVTKVEDAKADAAAPADAVPASALAAARKVVDLKVVNTSRPRFRDMVQDDEGCVDLGNSQALFIALLAIVLYVVSAFPFLSQFNVSDKMTLPDVDTTLLSLFGLGQGAYLLKKIAATAGKG